MIAAAGTAARADDVNLTTTTHNGISLDTFVGTTVQIAAGVTVDNTTFTSHCSTFPGICATTQAWTLTNNGTAGYVFFEAGGSLINNSTVSATVNSVWIEGGTLASVDNKLGATIQGSIVLGENTPVVGSVINAGTITSGDQAIGLWDGGSITNLATGVIQGHGGSNGVAIIQGTTRTIDNYGLIQSNDSGYAAAVSLQGGTLTNYAGGRILGAYNGAWTYTFPTAITNAGYIEASLAQGGGSAIEVDAGGTVINSGTIKSLTSNSTTTDAGIAFTGAGSITNSGTIMSATGGLAIEFIGSAAHTLTLDTGSILGGNVQAGTGTTEALVLNGTGTESAAKFLSFKTLSMQGTEWNLTNSATFSSSVSVQSGTLHVNGTLTSPTVTVGSGGTLDVHNAVSSPSVTIASGGTLDGTGAITGATTILAGGTHAPGNSIGTETINGNYINHGTLSVEVSPTDADKVVVNGTVDIAGAALVLSESPTSGWSLTHDYTIIDNDNADAVTGTFASVTDNFAFLDPTVVYNGGTGNDVVLTLVRNALAFSSLTLTPNEHATAVGIETLSAGNPVYDAILPLSTGSVPAAFDQLSGEIYAGLGNVLVDHSRVPRDAALDQVEADFTALVGADRHRPARNLWTQVRGDAGVIFGDGNAAATSFSGGSMLAGGDAWLGDRLLVGVEGGVTVGDAAAPDRSSTASIDTLHAGIYGGADLDPLQLSFGASLSGTGAHVMRTPNFSGFAQTLSADTATLTGQLFGEIAYAFQLDEVTLKPFASLALIHVMAAPYRETGGSAALAGSLNTIDAAQLTLGLKAGTDLVLPGNLKSRVSALIGWEQTAGSTVSATHAFAGGSSFTVQGTPTGGELVLGGQFDVAFSPQASLTANYDARFGATAHQALTATLSGHF